jgi:hypothetical protein
MEKSAGTPTPLIVGVPVGDWSQESVTTPSDSGRESKASAEPVDIPGSVALTTPPPPGVQWYSRSPRCNSRW